MLVFFAFARLMTSFLLDCAIIVFSVREEDDGGCVGLVRYLLQGGVSTRDDIC
jgi:hypothetical protein